jgi:hypothetical protein
MKPSMQPFRLATALFALVLAGCTTLPGSQGNADAVLDASGVDAQLRHLQQPLAADTLVPDQWVKLVNATVADVLKPAAIRADMKQQLEKELSGRELASVQSFYESDTGKRVVAAETGATPAATGDGTDTAELDTLAQATGAGRAASMLAERGLNEAFDLALKHHCFGLDKVPMAGLLAGFVKKAQLASLRDRVNAGVRQRYAALSADDRASYLDFVKSAAGSKFLQVRGNVIATAAGRAGDALSAPMAEQVDALCAAAGETAAK